MNINLIQRILSFFAYDMDKIRKYDFKHFSDNCVDLKDKTFLRREAKRIAGEMMYYIKEIKAILEDE